LGSIRDLFGKIKSIDAKHGKFDFTLCLGDFFGPLRTAEEDSKDGEDEIGLLLEGKIEGAKQLCSDESYLTDIMYSTNDLLYHTGWQPSS
jgi:hypothetical protein